MTVREKNAAKRLGYAEKKIFICQTIKLKRADEKCREKVILSR